MKLFPLRLSPGMDLRRAIEDCLLAEAQTSAFLLSGIGSLTQATLRYAGRVDETVLDGPLELLSIAGSVSPDGAHLHMSVATASGEVFGGHAGYGNPIRTTAEILIAFLPDWQLSRQHDPQTGYKELVVRPRA